MSVDTLAIARSLRATELPQEQAEAIAAAIGSSIADGTATKADLVQLEARVEKSFEQMKVTMMTWFIGSTVTVSAVIIAALKL